MIAPASTTSAVPIYTAEKPKWWGDNTRERSGRTEREIEERRNRRRALRRGSAAEWLRQRRRRAPETRARIPEPARPAPTSARKLLGEKPSKASPAASTTSETSATR